MTMPQRCPRCDKRLHAHPYATHEICQCNVPRRIVAGVRRYEHGDDPALVAMGWPRRRETRQTERKEQK